MGKSGLSKYLLIGGGLFLIYEYATKGKYDLISKALGAVKSSSNYTSFNKRGGLYQSQ